MHDLAAALRLDRTGTGAYRAVVAPHWDVWYPNGGYLAALAYSAVQADASGMRAAALHCQFLRPARHGEADIAVEMLREGTNARFLRATMTQAGRAILSVTASMIQPGLAAFSHQADGAPNVPAAAALAAHRDLVENIGEWQSFWHNAEIRPCLWPEPVAASAPHWLAWMQFKADGATSDNCAAAQIGTMLMAADFGPFNAVVAGHDSPPRWIAPNLDLHLQVHALQDPEAWLLVDATSPRSDAGLVGGLTKLWSGDGVLLATVGAQSLCLPNPLHAVQVRWLTDRGLLAPPATPATSRNPPTGASV